MRGSASIPRAGRHGVFRSGGRWSVLAAVIALVALAPLGARAASASVTLDVSALQPFATVPLATCPVSVAEGADGVAVLDAAVRAGCIESYQTTTFEFGTFVDCINSICSTAATYWRMTENGDVTAYGVDGFTADEGDALGFSYTTFVGCFVGPEYC